MTSDLAKWVAKFENERRARLEAEALLSDRLRTLYQTKERLEEAQEKLVRKERLATLGELASGVGHELRHPLAVMSNAVYYLGAVIASPTPEVSEYLEILRIQLSMSEKIVTDLLNFARIKAPDLQSVSIADLIEVQLSRVDAPDGVRVDREIAKDLPAVRVDPIHAGQVLLNLVTNGLQAMEDAGGILTVRADADADRVRIHVEDTGPGVSEENREKIFEPLFTTKPRGLGLGLSVSRSLIEANEGRLYLSDATGPGGRFVLELPVAR